MGQMIFNMGIVLLWKSLWFGQTLPLLKLLETCGCCFVVHVNQPMCVGHLTKLRSCNVTCWENMESIEIQCQACPSMSKGPILFGCKDINRIASSPAPRGCASVKRDWRERETEIEKTVKHTNDSCCVFNEATAVTRWPASVNDLKRHLQFWFWPKSAILTQSVAILSHGIHGVSQFWRKKDANVSRFIGLDISIRCRVCLCYFYQSCFMILSTFFCGICDELWDMASSLATICSLESLVRSMCSHGV